MDEDNQDPKSVKARSPYYQANNAGGYGNPPVSGQRKKGDPGGPGRPKGDTSLDGALKRVFRKKRPVVRDGTIGKMHPNDIMAERILEAFLAKDLSPSMIKLACWVMERFGPQMPEEKQDKVDWSSFSNDELHLFGGLLLRASGAEPEDRRIEGHYCVTRRSDGHIVVEKIEEMESQSALPTP